MWLNGMIVVFNAYGQSDLTRNKRLGRKKLLVYRQKWCIEVSIGRKAFQGAIIGLKFAERKIP